MHLPVDYRALTQPQRRQIREQYIVVQEGLCECCKVPLTEPPRKDIQDADINERLFPVGFFDHPIHLHHNHDTGMPIGAVRARCNAYLWQYEGE